MLHDVSRCWGLAPALLTLSIVFIVPVLQVLASSIFDSRGIPDLSQYFRLFHTPLYLHVLSSTFRIAGWTTLICIVVGYPLAYYLATSSGRSKTIFLFGVLSAFWSSVLVRTFAWILILGRHGVIDETMRVFGFDSHSWQLIYNSLSVLVGMSHALMPLGILTMLSVMQNIESVYGRAAATLGASGPHVFWRIYFPMSLPGVAAAALLIFVTAIGYFITPTMLGGPKDVMIAQIIVQQIDQMLDFGFAGAVAVLLLVATCVVFLIFDRMLGMAVLTGDTNSRNIDEVSRIRHRLNSLGRKLVAVAGWLSAYTVAIFHRWIKVTRVPSMNGRFVLYGLSLLVVAFLAGPSLFLIPLSFTSDTGFQWPPHGFSLQWYSEYFTSPIWIGATLRSLLVAFLTSFFALFLGVPAAFVLSRQNIYGKSAIIVLMLMPMIIPRIIVALALFYAFSKVGLLGTSTGLILGHTVFALPYVVITMMAVLRTYDTRLDYAAYTMGASKFATFRYVTFPLMGAGIATAFLFSFVQSFDELTVALFVNGGVTTTLPRQLWSEALMNTTPTLAAVSTVIFLFVLVVIFGVESIRRIRFKS
ncbi:ABC transporter permease subunit [Paraburkholderia sp. Ac-20342]|nr:ABC transporter permease subunit [Paraburkholderia sp. Ac-20342]